MRIDKTADHVAVTGELPLTGFGSGNVCNVVVINVPDHWHLLTVSVL